MPDAVKLSLQRAEGPDYGTEAFLAVRARFHLSYRLAVRFAQLAPDGGARTPGWQALVVVFLALDVGLWFALRNPQRFGLKSRLAIDSVDVAVWSLAPYPAGLPYFVAVLIGFPLALEAGLRMRLGGLVVPAAIFTTTALTGVVAGRPVFPSLFLWLVLAVACGLLAHRYMGRLQRRAEAAWAHRRSAEHRRAFLAGQNAVAMGASSVVDAIEGVVPALGHPEPDSALWKFASGWKPGLYQSTIGHAAYLGQVLSEWSAEHNCHPDLSSRVELHTAEGIGTTLLTGRQEAELRRQLSGLVLRGSWSIELADPTVSQRPPGGALVLRLGPHALALPADTKRPPRPFDPSPTAFVLAAFLMVGDMLGFPLRPSAVVPVIVLSLAAAFWAHGRLRRLGTAARPMILAAAMVIALVYATSATTSLVQPVNRGGLEQYPLAASLGLLALLGGMYWDKMALPLRWVPAGGAALVVVLGWVLHPVGHQPEHLLIPIGWTLPVLVCASRLARELTLASGRYSQALIEEDEKEEAAAFRSGRDTVTDLVRQARNEAHGRLAVVAATLPPRLLDNVRRRLEEVDRRLETMVTPGGSSSSTTMN